MDLNKELLLYSERGVHLGLGAIPFVMVSPGAIKIGTHCKTPNAPHPTISIGTHCKTPDAPRESVFLGRTGPECTHDSIWCIRPSPAELKRFLPKPGTTEPGQPKPRGLCLGEPIHTLVNVNGIHSGPVEIALYKPGITVPICINADPKVGVRQEEILFFPVPSLDKAVSVFEDADIVIFDISTDGVSTRSKMIPEDLLVKWTKGDDSIDPDPALHFMLDSRTAIQPSVPGSSLLLYLLTFLREKGRQ